MKVRKWKRENRKQESEIRKAQRNGRIQSIHYNGTSAYYASSVAYNTASQVTGFSYANGVSASYGYSSNRLQLTSLSYAKSGTNLLSLSYSYSQSGNNNGEIASITDNVESGRTVSYTYDSLHRVSTAVTSGSTPYPQWGLSWTYDRYGNRTAQSRTHGSTAPINSPTISTSTNRITALNSTNFTYDSNGNLTLDDLYKYKYDAENRLVELRYPNDTLIASYAYDGKSLRVVKVWGADRTFYIYAGTQLISEFEDAASNTYNSGTTPGQTGSDSGAVMLYQHADRLTTRLTTENTGQLSNEQAHYPYGEQWFAVGTADPSVLRKFTSYQKEDEAATGKLNYAVYREQSARVGRFHMADPDQGGTNPQGLNRYAYVSNDPVNASDSLGLREGRERSERGQDGDGSRFSGFFGFNIHGSFLPPDTWWFPSSGNWGGGCSVPNSSPPTVSFTGGTGGLGLPLPGVPAFGCAVPAASSPKCFAKLRQRHLHTWWHVRDANRDEGIISGDGSHPFPKLNVYYTAGTRSSINEDSSTAGRELSNSGQSERFCAGVASMVNVAKNFPRDRLTWHPIGPNSNSISSCMMLVGGLFVNNEPTWLPGWRWPLHGVGGCP